MSRRSLFGLLVLAPFLVALVLPPPATSSRERRFCRAWLELSPAERQQVLIDADEREAQSDVERSCRDRARPALRQRLDAECRNWSQLMDFEVRAIVDAGIARCLDEAERRSPDLSGRPGESMPLQAGARRATT